MEKIKPWFHPKNLKKSEIKPRIQENNIDINNDFGSYKIMLKTGRIELSNIHNHNDLNPKKKILSIKKALKNIICENPNKILNVGCGLGFETKALTEIYSCDITGVDVSEDGIEYAKKFNSNLKTTFIPMIIDKNFLLKETFEMCYAIEFYPFSRTEDLNFQKQIVTSLINNLGKNGALVIYQLGMNNGSIEKNFENIAKSLRLKSTMINDFHPKIFRFLNNLKLTSFFCKILSKIFNRSFGKTIICFKKGN